MEEENRHLGEEHVKILKQQEQIVKGAPEKSQDDTKDDTKSSALNDEQT